MSILIINIIECKKKGYIKVFTYALFMFNKNSIIGNIDIFENLIITQIGIKKNDPCLTNCLIIW